MGGGGATWLATPREGVAAWTGAPPWLTRVVPQSAPARVYVVYGVGRGDPRTECWEVAPHSS